MNIKQMLYVILQKVKQLFLTLRTDTNWTSINATNGGKVFYRVVKGFVWVYVEGVKPTNTWQTIATLPSELYPSKPTYGRGAYAGNGKEGMTVYVNIAGNVRISTASSAAENSGYATVIYPLI